MLSQCRKSSWMDGGQTRSPDRSAECGRMGPPWRQEWGAVYNHTAASGREACITPFNRGEGSQKRPRKPGRITSSKFVGCATTKRHEEGSSAFAAKASRGWVRKRVQHGHFGAE